MISHARYNDIIIFGLRSLFDYGFTSEPRDALIRLPDTLTRMHAATNAGNLGSGLILIAVAVFYH